MALRDPHDTRSHEGCHDEVRTTDSAHPTHLRPSHPANLATRNSRPSAEPLNPRLHGRARGVATTRVPLATQIEMAAVSYEERRRAEPHGVGWRVEIGVARPSRVFPGSTGSI